MNKKLPLLLLLPLIMGCSNSSSSSATPSSEAPSSELPSSESISSENPSSSSEAPSGEKYLFYNIKNGETKEGLTGSPWLNVMSPGIVSKIEKPSLKDDFFVATNYDYLSTASLNEGQIGDGGTLSALVKLQQNYEAIGTNDTLKGDYAKANRKAYSLYKNEDKAKDIAAVNKLINQVKTIQNKNDLIAFISSPTGASFSWSFFDLMRFETGLMLSEVNGWSMANSVLPFLNNDEAEKQMYIEGYSKVLKFFGIEENEAKQIVSNGLELDASFRSNSGIPEPSKNYKVGTINETFPSLNLKGLFNNLGYQDDVVINMLDQVYTLLAHVDQYNDESKTSKIKDDLIVRICLGAKAILPDDLYIELAQQFDPFGAGYNEEMFLRERYVESLKNVYDRAYIDNFETKERKEFLINIMHEVKAEYKNIINDASWLGNETKAKAQTKLDAIRFDCCYPDSLLSLPTFTLGEEIDNYYDVISSYRLWSFNANQPIISNPEMWEGSVTLINAVYNPLSNSFTVYDGILSANNYEASDMEGIYASIGTVIGHEISHSFDNSGSQYDEHGHMVDWWSKEDRAAFTAKSQKVIDAWNKISYKEGVDMWSDKMLGEIIADMGGMSVILKLASKKENFNYERFFNEYSKSYASVLSPEFVEMMYYQRQDVHPMNYLRVNNVLNQYEKFHEIFGIKEGDRMYVKAEDNLIIW